MARIRRDTAPSTPAETATPPPREPARRWQRALIVALAVLLPQIALFWPSLTGQKILLPLDVLTIGETWLGHGDPLHQEEAQDRYLSDLVFVTELNRRFCVDEVRAGRFPWWTPYIYCGAPFFAANHPAVLSPYRWMDYALKGPAAIAWAQLLKSLVAGVGVYLFLRRALGSSFMAGLAGASMFPLCGYMVLWAGFTLSNVASFLPWILWAADATVKRALGFGAIGLALVTTLIIFSGHAANAGHLLVAAVLYAVWRAHDQHGLSTRRAFGALGAVALGLFAGLALSAPQLLPTLEYMQQSARIAARADGLIETESMGSWALLQACLPYTLGSGERGAGYLVATTRFESAATAYAGLIALLVLVPLAFAASTQRKTAWFFAALGAFAFVPILGVPVIQEVFTWPPLNLVRNNRFTIVTAFALVVLAALGVDALVRGRFRPGRMHWIALCVAVLFVLYGVARFVYPPAPDPELTEIAAWFARYDALGLALALVACGGWFAVRRVRAARAAPILIVLVVLDLILNAWGVNPQCDPKLYYPPLPVLQEVARREPGRVLGVDCLLPNLIQSQGLCDVRGYDAADPIRMVELLRAGRDPDSARLTPEPPYAATLFHVPKNPSGISDLLSLRWVVLVGSPAEGDTTAFTGGGHSLFENTRALPRATVPRRVQSLPEKKARLAALASDAYDPRAIAYVETAVPAGYEHELRGSARITAEVPSRVELELDLETDALVRLADAYDEGWRAEVDGVEHPVVVVDHAVRGVFAKQGSQRLVFTYRPRSLASGLLIAALALVLMGGWAATVRRRRSA
ncbi:MAG: hypothetical protein JNL28_06765 [Planctomycetes bacterium]|nr:hypothetical protein [Planctomycetota bacterium]